MIPFKNSKIVQFLKCMRPGLYFKNRIFFPKVDTIYSGVRLPIFLSDSLGEISKIHAAWPLFQKSYSYSESRHNFEWNPSARISLGQFEKITWGGAILLVFVSLRTKQNSFFSMLFVLNVYKTTLYKTVQLESLPFCWNTIISEVLAVSLKLNILCLIRNLEL